MSIQFYKRGAGVDEKGYDAANPERILVQIDPQYFRPTEVEQLLGDPSKAKNKKLLYIRRRKEPNGISNIFYSFKSINKKYYDVLGHRFNTSSPTTTN